MRTPRAPAQLLWLLRSRPSTLASASTTTSTTTTPGAIQGQANAITAASESATGTKCSTWHLRPPLVPRAVPARGIASNPLLQPAEHNVPVNGSSSNSIREGRRNIDECEGSVLGTSRWCSFEEARHYVLKLQLRNVSPTSTTTINNSTMACAANPRFSGEVTCLTVAMYTCRDREKNGASGASRAHAP